MAKRMKKVYSLFEIELDHDKQYATIGLIWLFAIILFPIWIWFYIIYKILWHLGKSLNHVKVDEVEEEEDTYY